MFKREKYSVLLVLLGLILALLPLRATRSLSARPENLLARSLDNNSCFTVDQVARFISNEDPTIHLIDLRSPEEFKKSNLPGSENIPYPAMLDRDPSTYLGSGNYKNIFYSNGDLKSGYAVVIAGGLGYKNCYSMKGGMNEWLKTVMNTTFSGEKISASVNALFEARTKAGRLYREMNALPDSLKIKYLNSKRFNAKKLDGGCE
jgi:rhodanese-related sulfurtransferase